MHAETGQPPIERFDQAGPPRPADPALGRRVELRYDPEDLICIEVFLDGKPAGAATPFITRRHVHRAVPQAARPAPDPTGIDYLGLVAAAHEEAAGTGAKIDFTALGPLTAGHPGQRQEQDKEKEQEEGR